jgi:hypothetical protein
MAKPSTLWPVEPLSDSAVPTATNASPQPGHADTLKPDDERLKRQEEARQTGVAEDATSPENVKTQAEMQEGYPGDDLAEEAKSTPASTTLDIPSIVVDGQPAGDSGHDLSTFANDDSFTADQGNMDRISSWEPKAAKVLMDDPQATPLELRAQIQMYATNEYVGRNVLHHNHIDVNTGN